jgi:hypothetical protein
MSYNITVKSQNDEITHQDCSTREKVEIQKMVSESAGLEIISIE